MNTKQAIQATMDMGTMVLTRYMGDLDDADLLRRPGKGCNHLAWQIGHLISSEVGLVNSVCPGKGAELPEGFEEKHSREKTNVDDPQQFCTKQQYLDLMEKVRRASLAALAELPESELDAPSPERIRSFCPTVGNVFVLIGTHPLMHAGQFVPVRRELGKPVVI